jgi:methionine-rich copper-binding protein CopC
MKFRNIFAAPVVALSLLATPMVQAAAINSPAHAMFGKSKNVKLTLLNESGSPMEVKAGEEVIKLDQGKPVTVSLLEGTRVVSNTTTEKTQAGTLIAEVSSALNGATIHIK